MSDKEGAAPPPEGVVPDFQHPQDVLHTINLVSQILSIVSVSIFMMLRIYAKTLIAPPFYLDDWMAVIAWFDGTLHRYGGGYHIYEISKDKFVGFLKGLYADTLVYGPNSYFTKLALLLIVIRVFRLNKKTIIGTYAVIVFMTGYYVPVLFLKMFICHPIAGYWDSTLNATCLNQRAIFVADTAVSAITDTAVLCLPIPVALSLRMSWTKRLKVILMLSAGGVATAASIVRMILVIQLQKSDDEPVDFIRFNLLGTAEVSIGMICACLPAINILFMRGLSGSQQSSHNTGQSSKKYFELKFLTTNAKFNGSKYHWDNRACGCKHS
ncbi:integral membrane protein [Colletotrichum scovillei]|uniref:Integral membrane protein n=1 Tax=Colletotrichum scovillei TaxID=1209932 RepID=A0A9P7UBX4_9PEZI|nr:integral membrane protein [Colletotrichum scovillei]KAG7068824.1 integral membrane protein [Colletotrichum scovillei]KAG7072780.1 integral membrane protein [Colletotrichum scovillei]